MRARSKAGRRAGFTLIELMVVAVIIGILIALLVPAITGAMRTSKNAVVTADLNTISQSLAKFQAQYGDYPPSRILLSENGTYDLDPGTPAAPRPPGRMIVSANGTAGTDITYAELGRRSVEYLRKFWPRVAISTNPALPQWAPNSPIWYDFDGDGVKKLTPYILEGDECLTFFLGGIPLNTGTQADPKWSMSGFGKNPQNPFTNNLDNVATVPSNTMYSGNRTPPLLEFKAERLKDTDAYNPARPQDEPVRFPSYHDYLGTGHPIVYFSAYGSQGYDPNDCNWGPLDLAGKPDPAQMEQDDAGIAPILRAFRVSFPVLNSTGTMSRVANSTTPNPYTTSLPNGPTTTTYHKGQSYQLISAGADGLYGLGGIYEPEARTRLPLDGGTNVSTSDSNIRFRERDNLVNFANGTME